MNAQTIFNAARFIERAREHGLEPTDISEAKNNERNDYALGITYVFNHKGYVYVYCGGRYEDDVTLHVIRHVLGWCRKMSHPEHSIEDIIAEASKSAREVIKEKEDEAASHARVKADRYLFFGGQRIIERYGTEKVQEFRKAHGRFPGPDDVL